MQCRRPGFNPWVRKIPWRRKWQPTPVPLPGKLHGQRSLVGYSPWGHRESDTTERLHFHFHLAQSPHNGNWGPQEGKELTQDCAAPVLCLWPIYDKREGLKGSSQGSLCFLFSLSNPIVTVTMSFSLRPANRITFRQTLAQSNTFDQGRNVILATHRSNISDTPQILQPSKVLRWCERLGPPKPGNLHPKCQ